MPDREKNSGTAGHRTTSRILDILELVSQHKDGLSFTAVAQSMGMPKSSLHPLLQTLSARGYLYYNHQLQRYFLGENLYKLGNLYASSVDILKEIQQKIDGLSGEISETVYFGVRRGNEVLYLAKADPDVAIRIVTAGVGFRIPVHCTGLGKALLIDLSPEQLQALFPGGMEALTPNTITSVEQLHRQLVEMRAQGFAHEKEESTIGIQCIAVPIRVGGRVAAAVSSSVPVFRFTPELADTLKRLLREVAVGLESLIAANMESWSRLYPGE